MLPLIHQQQKTTHKLTHKIMKITTATAQTANAIRNTTTGAIYPLHAIIAGGLSISFATSEVKQGFTTRTEGVAMIMLADSNEWIFAELVLVAATPEQVLEQLAGQVAEAPAAEQAAPTAEQVAQYTAWISEQSEEYAVGRALHLHEQKAQPADLWRAAIIRQVFGLAPAQPEQEGGSPAPEAAPAAEVITEVAQAPAQDMLIQYCGSWLIDSHTAQAAQDLQKCTPGKGRSGKHFAQWLQKNKLGKRVSNLGNLMPELMAIAISY